MKFEDPTAPSLIWRGAGQGLQLSWGRGQACAIDALRLLLAESELRKSTGTNQPRWTNETCSATDDLDSRAAGPRSTPFVVLGTMFRMLYSHPDRYLSKYCSHVI